MSHGESCTGVVTSSVVGVVGGHKKLRRKRKELDALVHEDKVRRKPTSTSHHDLLRSDSEDAEGDFSGVAVLGKQMMGGRGGLWACLPGACTLLLLITTLVGIAAAFRLLMLTRRDLDALHARISTVEASSSELPAKFHQSHVRLQELEKNQSALWAAVSQLTSSLEAVTKRVDLLEDGMKGVENSLNTSPQLSSLPKDVATLQGSVATFGSTLQDVQSSLKVIKKDHNKLSFDVKETATTIDRLREDISVLKNQTVMEHVSGGGSPLTLGESVLELREMMNSLTTTIISINASFTKQATDTSITNHRLQNLEELDMSKNANLSQRMSSLEEWRSLVSPELPSHITNLTSSVASLQDATRLQSHTLHNLTQSMDVVKGVEKRLEGSQVQLASSVSELKQQLQKVEKSVSFIKAAATIAKTKTTTTTTTTPAVPVSPSKHTSTTRD